MNTEIVLDSNRKWLMVAYTDGGCRPNPGSSGSGVHAYITEIPTDNTEVTHKPIRFSKNEVVKFFLPTDKGYQYCSKDSVISPVHQEKGIPVKPSFVLEMAESSSNQYTNNYAEVKAFLNALKISRLHGVNSLRVITDSEYTIKAVTKFRSIWENNGFITSQGQPVKNKELFQALFTEYDHCIASGISITCNWIKGHQDHPGNYHADMLATIGVVKSQQSLDDSSIYTYRHKDYWEPKRDRHPLMSLKRLYFNRHYERNTPGVYYMADPGKDDVLVGKPLPETVYAVVKMKEPDDIVESVIEAQGRYEQDFNVTMMIKLESIFYPSAFRLVSAHGSNAMLKAEKTSNVVLPDGYPMSVERNPIGVTMRAIDAINSLEGILDYYEAKTGMSDSANKGDNIELTIHDVTDQFYDTVVGKDQISKKSFKKDFVVGQKSATVEFTLDGKQKRLPLRLGLDILDRNSLKQLETSDPVIHLITWRDSSVSLRYASVLLCNEGHAIWSNFFADRIMSKKHEEISRS